MEYPDGTKEQVISDPFHICDGEFMSEEGEVSYDDTDLTVRGIFPVWSGVEESRVTVSAAKL